LHHEKPAPAKQSCADAVVHLDLRIDPAGREIRRFPPDEVAQPRPFLGYEAGDSVAVQVGEAAAFPEIALSQNTPGSAGQGPFGERQSPDQEAPAVEGSAVHFLVRCRETVTQKARVPPIAGRGGENAKSGEEAEHNFRHFTGVPWYSTVL
jgi:hypothetical protein